MDKTTHNSIDSGMSCDDSSLAIWWVVSALVFGFYFAAWWMHLRPGVFSFDSGYYLSEVVSGDITNRKPFLYARFIELTSFGGRMFQVTIATQVSIVVLVLSRAFAIAMDSRVSPVWIVLCAVIVLNPYVANMTFYLQNDVLFSFSLVAILIETLFVARRGNVSTASYVMVALASPMAFAFRENGLLFLPLWCALLLLLGRRDVWQRLVAVSVISTVVAYGSIIGVDRERTADLMYPAAIHEVARLAQGGYRHDIGGRLSPETREAVGIDRLRSATSMYWPLYWDTIGFFPGGPNLASLPSEQRGVIVRSFLRNDLLPNLPSVAGHRIEVLFGALLARAEYVDPYSAPSNLPGPLKAWKERVGAMNRGSGVLGRLNDASIRSRAWSWNAGFGVLVLAGITLMALWRREKITLIVVGLLWIQMATVLAVAPSAEYRYVFMLYLAPLLLLAGDPHRPRSYWPARAKQ